jgi:cation transport ATPase
MDNLMTVFHQSAECRIGKPSLLGRYSDFLLSGDTLLTFANAILLATGFAFSLFGAPGTGKWLYLAAVVIGGFTLFLFAAKGLLLRGDIMAGVVVATATLAAIGNAARCGILVITGAVIEQLADVNVIVFEKQAL